MDRRSPQYGIRFVSAGILLGLFLLSSATCWTVPEARAAEPALFLEITEPLNNSILRSGNVIVSGRTVPGANVTVNGEQAFNDNGSFIKGLSFREGPGAIHIQVVSGNDSLVRVLNLTVDMTSPRLDIIEPLGPTVWKTGAVLRWRAMSEPGVNVTLNDIPMTYEGKGVYTGELRRTADLRKVTVKATDAAGNSMAESITIPPPPRFIPEPSLLDRLQPWMVPTLLVGIFLIVGGLVMRSKRR